MLTGGSFFWKMTSRYEDVQSNSFLLPSHLPFVLSRIRFMPFLTCSFQGEAACQQINAEIYLECSAKCRENIENVFKEATTIALSAMKKAKRQKKQRACSVLWSGLQESTASYEPSYSDFNNGVTTLFFPPRHILYSCNDFYFKIFKTFLF